MKRGPHDPDSVGQPLPGGGALGASLLWSPAGWGQDTWAGKGEACLTTFDLYWPRALTRMKPA